MCARCNSGHRSQRGRSFVITKLRLQRKRARHRRSRAHRGIPPPSASREPRSHESASVHSAPRARDRPARLRPPSAPTHALHPRPS